MVSILVTPNFGELLHRGFHDLDVVFFRPVVVAAGYGESARTVCGCGRSRRPDVEVGEPDHVHDDASARRR
jgi:hypothetical protein